MLPISSQDEPKGEIEDKFTSYKEVYLFKRLLKGFSLCHRDFESIQMLTDLHIHFQDIEIQVIECGRGKKWNNLVEI